MSLCPCGTGRDYPVCCGRFHKAQRQEPTTPEELMRSRFSAFARADSDWLYRSLHPDHDDRKISRSAFRRDLDRHFATGVRYLRLEILDAPSALPFEAGYVLFVAHGIVKGSDFLLAELSTFLHDGHGWRYRSGQTIPDSAIGRPEARTTIRDLERRGIVAPA